MLRIHDTYADTHGPMTDVDVPPEAARPLSVPAAEAASGADD